MNDLLGRFELVPHVTAHTQKHIGAKFSRLTVLAVGRKVGTYRYTAICNCDCGKGPFPVRIDKLTSGHTQSCGCLHPDAITKHGLYKNPLYRVWNGIMRRCYNEKDSHYHYYGGRGIKVCDRWQSVENFVADMSPSYREGLQIDRVNNDEGYSPDNCVWASFSEQQRNKRSNINVTIDGETKCLAEWCNHYGMRYQLVHERITMQGWEAEKALRTPARKLNPKRSSPHPDA